MDQGFRMYYLSHSSEITIMPDTHAMFMTNPQGRGFGSIPRYSKQVLISITCDMMSFTTNSVHYPDNDSPLMICSFERLAHGLPEDNCLLKNKTDLEELWLPMSSGNGGPIADHTLDNDIGEWEKGMMTS